MHGHHDVGGAGAWVGCSTAVPRAGAGPMPVNMRRRQRAWVPGTAARAVSDQRSEAEKFTEQLAQAQADSEEDENAQSADQLATRLGTLQEQVCCVIARGWVCLLPSLTLPSYYGTMSCSPWFG